MENVLCHLKPAVRRLRANSFHSRTSSFMAAPSAIVRRTPVLLLDIMDTVVRDPFFTHMAPFFNLTFKELLQQKHPTAWLEFEKGLICEDELFAKFFQDGRSFDGQALIETMVGAYEWVEGMEPLLNSLTTNGYELHAMSNYPSWHRYIEEKLQLSRYLRWTFVSCEGAMKGMRKPSPEAYGCAIDTLQVPAADIIFVDDREVNVVAARQAGMQAVLFSNATDLAKVLREHGLEI